MANNSCRARAEAQARAIIAQRRAQAPSAQEPEPMNRYIHPIPQPAQAAFSPCDGRGQLLLERILETLICQNQLLLDLQASVNALSAAVLTAQADS